MTVLAIAVLTGCAQHRRKVFAEHVLRLQQEAYWASYCAQEGGSPLKFTSVTIEIQSQLDANENVTVPVGGAGFAPGLTETKGHNVQITFGLPKDSDALPPPTARFLPQKQNVTCPTFK
jgi:hypothetical protein